MSRDSDILQKLRSIGVHTNGLVCYSDGTARHTDPDQQVVIDKFLTTYTYDELKDVKTAACDHIDTKAELLRNAVLTPGSGQMAAYQRKEAQARAVLTDTAPTAQKYPAIYSEIGITATTAQDVAAAVIAQANAWWAYGDAIEATRLAGKHAVEAVTEEQGAAGVAAAEAGIVWPTIISETTS
jgi:hypothetical protein